MKQYIFTPVVCLVWSKSVYFPFAWFHTGKMSSELESINKKPRESRCPLIGHKSSVLFCRQRKHSLFSCRIFHIIQNGPVYFTSLYNCRSHLDHISNPGNWTKMAPLKALQGSWTMCCFTSLQRRHAALSWLLWRRQELIWSTYHNYIYMYIYIYNNAHSS